MEHGPKDYGVVRLLTKLKNSNGSYPPDLLISRRRNFIRQMEITGITTARPPDRTAPGTGTGITNPYANNEDKNKAREG